MEALPAWCPHIQALSSSMRKSLAFHLTAVGAGSRGGGDTLQGPSPHCFLGLRFPKDLWSRGVRSMPRPLSHSSLGPVCLGGEHLRHLFDSVVLQVQSTCAHTVLCRVLWESHCYLWFVLHKPKLLERNCSVLRSQQAGLGTLAKFSVLSYSNSLTMQDGACAGIFTFYLTLQPGELKLRARDWITGTLTSGHKSSQEHWLAVMTRAALGLVACDLCVLVLSSSAYLVEMGGLTLWRPRS